MFSVSAMMLSKLFGVVSSSVPGDVSLLSLWDAELLICCVSAA